MQVDIRRIAIKAGIVDLRYRMKKVLRALECREPVSVLYRGKVKGTIVPAGRRKSLKARAHPAFAMLSADKRPVGKVMEELRGGRFRGL